VITVQPDVLDQTRFAEKNFIRVHTLRWYSDARPRARYDTL
jgi:hypothetical protein